MMKKSRFSEMERRRKRNNRVNAVKFFSVVFVFTALFLCSLVKAEQVHVYTGTVTDKVVKNYSDSSKYIVFVTLTNGQEMTFEDTDSLVHLKYNSSDIFGELQTGHKYQFKVCGFRNYFMSWYPNILGVKPQ